MKKSAFLILSISLFLVVGCDKREDDPIKRKSRIEFAIANTITQGNFSYIPFCVSGDPSEHTLEILEVINEFEKNHPELQIISYYIDSNQRTGVGVQRIGAYISGIRLVHQQKSQS